MGSTFSYQITLFSFQKETLTLNKFQIFKSMTHLLGPC